MSPGATAANASGSTVQESRTAHGASPDETATAYSTTTWTSSSSERTESAHAPGGPSAASPSTEIETRSSFAARSGTRA